jgi:hypothetical protein
MDNHVAAPATDHTSGRHAPWPRPRRWQIFGAVIGTVAVTAAVVLAMRPNGRLIDAAAQVTASSPAGDGTPTLARRTPETVPPSVLRRIADHLVAAPYEAHNYTFEYIDIRTWGANIDGGGAAAGPEPAAVSVRRTRYWTNAGDAGRWYIVDEARGCPADDQSWTHQEASPWGGPLSSDPAAVRRQLLGPPPNGGIDLFGQISELYSNRILPLATRRGLITMLATRPHVIVQRDVTDAAGRHGVAVTDTGPPLPPSGTPLHRTLLFDPSTGDLLAAITTTATSPPDYAAQPGERSSNLAYALHLARRYTPNVHTPKPDCTRPTTAPPAHPGTALQPSS